MSGTHAIDGTVGRLQSCRLAQRWSAVRARASVGRLDAQLANGADPWSSTELMLRAARVASLAERRRLAGALARLVRVDRTRPLLFQRAPLRHELIDEHADELLRLADRLEQLEPVDVGTLAELALLVGDGRSPIYAGGGPPSELARVLARALRVLKLA
jgi:hypothetical protein